MKHQMKNLNKYLSIFKISLSHEFAYGVSFLMWRLRNIIQILIFLFLWTAVFQGRNQEVFGYNLSKILTYAFLLVVMRSLVLSSKSNDVAGIISSGDLSNLLLKPVNFFKYWLTRDLSTKVINILFSVVEIFILFLIFKPELYLQTNPVYISLFLIQVIVAILIFFCLMMITSFVPFWVPELGWGAQFFVIAISVELLSGALFPLDIFPSAFFNFLRFTPIPYLIYVPIKTYLGSFDINFVFQGILISILWLIILYKLMISIWQKGLKVYEGVGR